MPGDAETAVILEGTLAYTSPEQTGRITPPFQPDDVSGNGALPFAKCRVARGLTSFPPRGENVSISKGRLDRPEAGAVKFFVAQEWQTSVCIRAKPWVKLSRRSREARCLRS